MLNILVDKAIQRSTEKNQCLEPIFTISYSSIGPSNKNKSNTIQKSKTVVKKIPKIARKDENIFQKWKSKTLEKLKNFEGEAKPISITNKEEKSFSTIFRQNDDQMQSNLQSSNLNQPKQLGRSFIVHQKKIFTKNYTVQSNNKKNPLKSLYLLYKDQKKNTINKTIPTKCFYNKKVQQKSSPHNIQKSIDERKQCQSPNKQSQKNQLTFFNTIQYRTVPKDEIRHYKVDQFEQIKRFQLNRTENIFVRNRKYKNPSFFDNISTHQPQQIIHKEKTEAYPQDKLSQGNNIRMRKIFTEKRSRKKISDTIIINPETEKTYADSYRPWSPIKTNPPLLFINEQELLHEKSKTLDIFTNLQKGQDDLWN